MWQNYFRDCVEEVGLELEARGIELGYFNFVDEDVMVIADAEQMKRVINNIIGNSLKYMDKKNGIINIRILDVGDFVQVGDRGTTEKASDRKSFRIFSTVSTGRIPREIPARAEAASAFPS